jgi:hypothetical protein
MRHETKSYEVIRHWLDHAPVGISVIGSLPVDDMCALLEAWKDKFDLADSMISERLGASLVVTTRALGKVWRRHLGCEGEK